MKIKKKIVIMSVVALAVVLFATAYFNLLLPVLNVLYNPIKGNGTDNGSGTIIRHDVDVVLDPDDPYHIGDLVIPGGDDTEATPDPDSKDPDGYDDPSETDDPENTTIGDGEFDIAAAVRIKASQLTFEKGTRNVLLIGFNPDEQLADSIFIVNIDESQKLIKLISVPRDTYVPHSKATQEAMKACKYYYAAGSHKINASYYVGSNIIKYVGGKFNNSGIDFMCAILSALLPGCEIDDYVYVDFFGFMDIIDVAGGIYVTSPENMYTVEGELAIRKGRYKLTAREALFYVRNRSRLKPNGENTFTGGDNYRKMNQANFITEAATQLFTKENMTMNKVLNYMDVLKKSVFHSITPAKLSYYLPIGVDFANKEYKVVSYVITGKEIDPFGDHSSYVQFD